MEKGESFLKNENYVRKNTVDPADKILPSSQPFTDFDYALNKASDIVNNVSETVSVPLDHVIEVIPSSNPATTNKKKDDPRPLHTTLSFTTSC